MFIMLAFLASIMSSCDGSSPVDERLAEAESLISSSSDSALILIDEIGFRDLSRMNEKQRAYLCIVRAKAKLRAGKSFITDNTFDTSLRYLESISDTVGLLDIYQLAAIKHRWLGQQDSSAYYIRKAIDIASNTTEPTQSELYVKLSNLYAYPTLKKDYNIALKYARLALSTATSPDEKARALHDIGLFHSFMNRNDSAATFMEMALNQADSDDPNLSTFILNYANLPSVELSRSVHALDRIRGRHLGRLITLGFVYLNHSRFDSAKHYLARSKELYNENPSQYSINTYNSLRLLEQSVGLVDKGIVFQNEGTVTNDSISMILDRQRKFAEEEKDYNNQLQIRLLESKNKRQLIWIISLSALILLCLCFGFFVWYAKRKYTKLRRQLETIKIDQIVTEANENTDETEPSEDIIRKRMNLCIEQFRISRLQADVNKMELEYRCSGSFPSVKSREAMQKELISCFADFIVDLKMTGAKLNVDDIVTCLMSCMKESNTAIAACLGTTETAVRTRKSRLRTKLPTYMQQMLEL